MNTNFDYSYSADEQKRLDEIRSKYTETPNVITKREQLEALDRKADSAGMTASLCTGILGTLIFGFGMCLALVWDMLSPGIIVGIIGFAVLMYAYPLYRKLNTAKKKELAPQILQLVSAIEKGAR